MMCMVPTWGAITSNSAETPPVSFNSIMENTRHMVLNFTMIKIGWTMISFCQLSKQHFQCAYSGTLIQIANWTNLIQPESFNFINFNFIYLFIHGKKFTRYTNVQVIM